jgi:polysaccharide pyruvyl transferase WcaK-like protein
MKAWAMRILVDQSGYDLLNLGDVAMLQSCVTRLRDQWPAAEIMVIATAPERLAAYCPGTMAVGSTFANHLGLRLVPRKACLALEQVWKIAGPYLARPHLRARPAQPPHGTPRTAVQAVRAADLVVASGGGYLNDTFWWHASGVLSLLSLAQRLGTPTAMLGQGIGPMNRRLLRAQARAVFPRLAVLGLREERIGRDLATSLGASPGALRLTGDDALENSALEHGGPGRGSPGDGAPGPAAGGGSAGDTDDSAAGHVLGVNLRVSGYAGVDQRAAAAVGRVIRETASGLGADLLGLPVSRYAAGSDAGALRALAPAGDGRAGVAVEDIVTPETLAAAAARCRAVITGSYHAAVFSLAAGVPAVCLTKSRYYDAKFGGLAALFPGACQVVSLDSADCAGRLQAAVQEAWQLPAAERAAGVVTACGLRDAGRLAYAQLRLAVEERGTHAGDQVMAR